jgi:hypothetical protein
MARDWRVAESLRVLRDEVNALAPRRSKASDGTVGDFRHRTRESDHNPHILDKGIGVVSAIDLTHDPDHGCDAGELAEHFRRLGRQGDPRVKYVIWNRQIASFIDNWRWRHYSGPNAHRHHVHLSVSSKRRHYDSRAPWGVRCPPPKPVPKPAPKPPLAPPPVMEEEDDDMKSDETIDLGRWGTAVLRDPDGQISVEEAMAIQTVATAQSNEALQAMAPVLSAIHESLAAQQKTQAAMLAELKRLTASGK